MRNLHIPGVSLAVVRDGWIVKAKGYELANIEANSTATPKTVYEIGSMTKQFTAAAVMMLVEESTLRFQADTVQQIYESRIGPKAVEHRLDLEQHEYRVALVNGLV